MKSTYASSFFLGLALSANAVAVSADTPTEVGSSALACRPAEIQSAQMLGDSPSLIMPGRQLIIRLKDFDAWFDCRQHNQPAMPVLYLDHVARPDADVVVDPAAKGLRYSLRLTDQNRAAWAAAAAAIEVGAAVGLGNASAETSLATEAGAAADGGAKAAKAPFRIAVTDGMTRLLGRLYVGALVVFSITVAWLSRLVRNRGTLAPGTAEWGRSYSLSRTQLFLWSVVVAGVAGYLWITTGLLPTMDVETLALLGVSAGTTGAATLIEGRNPAPAPVSETKGFFLLDLLDDGQGASIHRFQAVLANIGLAAIFVTESFRKLDFYTMPPSWTAVLALSSGVYLGLKAGESG